MQLAPPSLDTTSTHPLPSNPPPPPPTRQSQQLSALFDKYVGRILDWLRVTAKPMMFNEQVCHVNTLLTLLKASLKK